MTEAAASMGSMAQFGLTANASGNADHQFEVLRCGLAKHGTLVEAAGLRGTRSHHKDNVQNGPYTVGGPVVFEPRPDDLIQLLPFCLGAAANGNTYAVAETLPAAIIQVDKVAKVFTYAGMKVDKWEFACGGPGQNLRLTIDWEGLTEATGNAGSFPSIGNTLSTLQPYVFHQGVFTAGNTAYPINQHSLRGDNALVKDRHNNSQTRSQLPEADRLITFECTCPLTSDEIGLYDLSVAGLAATLVYTNGNRSVTFTLANMKLATESPTVESRTAEITWPLRFSVFADGNTKEIVVTNVNTA